MRVTLKSKHAEVGVDLFHVALPKYGKAGNHHLLAIKEDSESRCLTLEVPETPVPLTKLPLAELEPGAGARGTPLSGRASETPSSINEAVDVFNELEEVTLLINSQFEATPERSSVVHSAALNVIARQVFLAIAPLGFFHPSIQQYD